MHAQSRKRVVFVSEGRQKEAYGLGRDGQFPVRKQWKFLRLLKMPDWFCKQVIPGKHYSSVPAAVAAAVCFAALSLIPGLPAEYQVHLS
jgi:hypothetical protein